MKKVGEHAAKIGRFYRTYKRMPSYAEMAKIFGYASKNAVYRAVNNLIDDGVVSKDASGRLVPERLFGVRLLGLVEAGFPSPAEEELADTVTIDEYLIENHSATYLLKVKGDSMKDAGIYEGDLVVVERSEAAREGDIVIAEVDGDWTMKYLRKKSGRFYLEPANEAYEPIYPDNGMTVAAIVRGVIRKY